MSKSLMDAMREHFDTELDKIRAEAYPELKNNRLLFHVPPRAGKMMEFNIQRSAAERQRVRDIISEGVSQRVTVQSLGVELGNAFMSAMATELYRRQYRDERNNPEWVDVGGES